MYSKLLSGERLISTDPLCVQCEIQNGNFHSAWSTFLWVVLRLLEEAVQMNFNLKARINRSAALTIRQVLDQLAAKGSVRKDGDEFIVEAEMEGASAKEQNRTLLSALRKVEKRTTLRAEWTSGDTTERFFDYVLKKTIKGSR